jgi:protein SCO1/2
VKGRLLILAAMLATAAGPFDPFGEATIIEHPGAPVPVEAPLVDQQGRAVTLRALARGKPMLLVPVLHECPNICGVTLAGLMDAIAAQRQVAGRDFTIVAFGIDPREGPPQSLDDMRRLHAARPRAPVRKIAALTGPARSIAAITDALGYRYAWDPRIRQYSHASGTAVLTGDGHLSSWLYGVTPTGEDLARALDLARRGGSGSLVERLILLCYHFDPQSGRYSLAITMAVRIAGLAMVALLGFVLLRLSRARRDT